LYIRQIKLQLMELDWNNEQSESESTAIEVPDLDDAFWEKAQSELPKTKTPISLRLDADVLDWFKAQGKGYQTLMNSILKAYMKSRK